MADYGRYKTVTLKRMLERAEEKYYDELQKASARMTWGYGMRHSKLPQDKALEHAEERLTAIKSELKRREE